MLAHPNPQRYPGQQILVVRLKGYVHLVPYVETEEQLLADCDAGRLHSSTTPSLLADIKEASKATANKDQRINSRLSSEDLQAIRARVLREGIPYQTLISSVLHR